MTHARTQIRQAVVTLLTGASPAGNRVYASRVYPLDEARLPALLVFSNQEVVNEQSLTRPRTQLRQLSLTVEGYVKAQGNVDETTDSLALAVEKAIAADPTLGGLVKDAVLDTTETQLSGDGDKPVAVVTLTFAVKYAVKENAPQTLI